LRSPVNETPEDRALKAGQHMARQAGALLRVLPDDLLPLAPPRHGDLYLRILAGQDFEHV
jgi:hypothetical protein